MPRLHAIALVAIVVVGAVASRASAGVDELAQELRRLIAPGAADREQVLGALRALKDDRLRPLFSELAVGDDMIGRVQGVLALAESSDNASATTSMISRVASPEEQTLMIVRTLRDGLLSDDQIQEIIAWPGIKEELEVLLRSHIRKAEDPSMVSRLEELSTNESPAVGVIASLVLMDLGKPVDPESLMARLREKAIATDSLGVAYLLDFIRREQLTGAAQFVQLVLETQGIDMMTRSDALATMLVVAPERGAEPWNRAWQGAEGLVDQIRLALSAVSAWRTAPEDTLRAVASSGNPVISAMGGAALAFRTGQGEREKGLELWKSGYAPGIEWMVSSIEYLDLEKRLELRRALIESPIDGMRSDSLVLRMLADGMLEDDPSALCQLARNASMLADSRVARITLSAIVRAGRVECASEFDQLTWPDSGLTSLAQVVAAAAGNESVRADRLERTALGIGSLSRPARAVATWEALLRMGEERKALAQILAAP